MCRTLDELRILHRCLPTAMHVSIIINIIYWLVRREIQNSDLGHGHRSAWWQFCLVDWRQAFVLSGILMGWFCFFFRVYTKRTSLLIFPTCLFGTGISFWSSCLSLGNIWLNVDCSLSSRSSLLLGSARSCDSAGSALLRCLSGHHSKIDLTDKW